MGKSSFERVVGNVSDVEKEKILHEMDEQFDDQEFRDLVGKEREKTSEELQIIQLANRATNEVRRKYGLRDFEVPAENIHVIKEDEWPKRWRGSAEYAARLQGVAMREEHSNIAFSQKTVHEMLHFKSYNALQVIGSEHPQMDDYRVGLTVNTRDGKVRYFTNLNEAVTEEMTKEIVFRIKDDVLFEKEVEQTLALADRYPNMVTADGKKLFNNDTYYAEFMDKETVRDVIGRFFGTERSRTVASHEFSYKRERRILSVLIDKLFERNPKEFHEPDEVMDIFREGMMTGNLLRLGKLIDGTFGAGTLRRIGELDSDIEAQKEFVNLL